MTGPNLTPEPSGMDFGPDHTQTLHDPPPKVNQKNPPRASEKRDPFGKLGMNKKLRSPVRKLTDDDRDKIVSFYTLAAGGVMMIRIQTAQAMANSAEACADAWMEIAEKNDSVRRALLGIIEGGVWGKVIAAHLPILLTLIPADSSLGRMLSFGTLATTEEEFNE